MIGRIKQLMERKKLAAAQFADEIGIQRSSLSHVLSGRNKPSLDFMLKIKNRFPEIDLDWLLLGKGNMEFNQQEIKPPYESTTDKTVTVQSELRFDPSRKEITDKKENLPSQGADDDVSGYGKQKQMKKEKPVSIILIYKNGTFSSYEPQ